MIASFFALFSQIRREFFLYAENGGTALFLQKKII